MVTNADYEVAKLILSETQFCLQESKMRIAKLEVALLVVMREWNRDVEYATASTREWQQAEDALGRKIAPRDLKTLTQESAEVVPIKKAR